MDPRWRPLFNLFDNGHNFRMPPKRPRTDNTRIAVPLLNEGHNRLAEAYVRLYPGLRTRVREIFASDVPFMRERLASLERIANRDHGERQAWFAKRYKLTP